MEYKTDRSNNPAAHPGTERSLSARVIEFLHGIAPRDLWLAWGLLAVGLIVTVFAALHSKTAVDTSTQREFDFICSEIQLNITSRLASNAQVLYSGAALFDASETVTRQEWQIFTGHLHLDQELPGTLGIGFALLIPPEQLNQHILEI